MGCAFEQSVEFYDVKRGWRNEKIEDGYFFYPEQLGASDLHWDGKDKKGVSLKLEESTVEFLVRLTLRFR